MAPVASTICLARIFQSRSRRPAIGGAVALFHQGDEIVIEIGDRRRAMKHARPRVGDDAGQRMGDPGGAGKAVDFRSAPEQRTAGQGLIVGEDDAQAGGRCGTGRGDAGRAGADHQHVAMIVALFEQ